MIDFVLVEDLRCICFKLGILCKVCRSRRHSASVESVMQSLRKIVHLNLNIYRYMNCTMKRKDSSWERMDNYITGYLWHLPSLCKKALSQIKT